MHAYIHTCIKDAYIHNKKFIMCMQIYIHACVHMYLQYIYIHAYIYASKLTVVSCATKNVDYAVYATTNMPIYSNRALM